MKKSETKKSRATVPLKAKNATKIEMSIGQNVTAMGWSKLQWVMCHTVTRRPLFPLILWWTSNPSTLGQNVAVVKHYRVEVSQ